MLHFKGYNSNSYFNVNLSIDPFSSFLFLVEGLGWWSLSQLS